MRDYLAVLLITISCAFSCPCDFCGNTTYCSKMSHTIIPIGLPKSSITRLLLDNNNITEVGGSDLKQMFQMIELVLNNNKISRLGVDSLKDLKKLLYLHLDNNFLSHIELGTFSMLISLKRLFLEGNQLTVLPGDIPKLYQLERLSINRNRIKSIDWTSFVRMKSLSLAKLWQGNPIKCDCNTLELIKWLNLKQKISSPGKASRCKDYFLKQNCKEKNINSVFHEINLKPVYNPGDTLRLNCNITRNSLSLIVWRHPTKGLFYPYKDGRVNCLRNGTLFISPLNYEDNGRYTCYELMAEMRSLSSSHYTVKVRKANSNHTVSPKRLKVYVSLGSNKLISCTVSGKLKSKIKWFSPNNRIIFSQSPSISYENINKYEFLNKGRTLKINNISKEDVGYYKCVSSNQQGISESLIELEVGSEKDYFLVKVLVTCGVVVALVLSGVGAYFVKRSYNRKNNHVSTNETSQHNSHSLPYINADIDVQCSLSSQQLEQPYQTEPQIKGFRL